MRIHFSLINEGKGVTSTLSSTENESFHQQTWDTLYQNAQRHVPYYIVAVALLENGNAFSCKFYDGLALRKFLKTSDLDPETRLKIKHVHYVFFECLKFSHPLLLSPVISFPFKPRSFPSYGQQEPLTNLAYDPIYSTLLFDSLNAYAVEEGAERIQQLAKTQFMIGTKLMQENSLLGIQWIWCSAQKGLAIAQKMVGIYALNLENRADFLSNLEEAEKWLTLAADQEDQEAKDLLIRLEDIENQEVEEVE